MTIRFQPKANGADVRRPIHEVIGGPPGSGSLHGSSKWQRLRCCPREEKLYQLGIRKRGEVNESLDLGSMFHSALEAFHRAQLAGGDYQAACRAGWETLVPFRDEEGYATINTDLERMLGSYFELALKDRWTVIAVEETLVYEGDFNYSARLDLIVHSEEHDGMLVVEHKCLAGDMRIRDARTGSYRPVREWLGKPLQVQTFTRADAVTPGCFRVRPAEVTEAGLRAVLAVRLDSGRVLRVTDNHPVLTARGWVLAGQLSPRDFVPTPLVDLAALTTVETIPDDHIELAGLMLGDGTLRATRFTKSSGPVLDRVYALAERNGWGTTTHWQGACATVSLGAAARDVLYGLGIRAVTAAEKCFPDALLSLSRRQSGLLLGALWNTDGCVDVFLETRREAVQKKVRIAFSGRSEALCRGVQTLLTRLGIPSTLCKSSVLYQGARRDVWTTKVVQRRGKRTFFACVRDGLIPFVKYPIDAAEAAVKPGLDHRVPTAWLPPALRKGALESRGAATLAGTGFEDERLQWQRVVSVTPDGREMTYDVSVDGEPNFVTEDVITHNTAKTVSADMLTGYQLNLQVLGQAWLMHECVDLVKYPAFKGVLVNITTRHVRTQHHRIHVAPTAMHLREFERSMRGWAHLESQMEVAGHPKAFACSGASKYFRTCTYFDLCHGKPEMQLDNLQESDLPLGFTFGTESADDFTV